MKSHYYSQHAVALRAELGAAISRRQMRELHEKTAARHLVVAARQFGILALATWGLIRFDNPLIWVPLAFVQGFTIFNFTVLLHEVVHHTIFARRRPARRAGAGLSLRRAERDSASPVHALASGPSRRAWIGRRRSQARAPVAEGEQALVQAAVLHARAVPDLFPGGTSRGGELSGSVAAGDQSGAENLDGRASWRSSQSCGSCSDSTRRRGRHHPRVLHLPDRVHAEPSRPALRHRPPDPAKWGTLMKGHWFWDFAFLNSNYHLEHHYFPGVPFYRLPGLQRALVPFYEKKGMRWQTYGQLCTDGSSRITRRTPTGTPTHTSTA